MGQGHDVALSDNLKMPRSKSSAGVSNLHNIHAVQNGSKIPLRDVPRTLTVGGTDIHQSSRDVPRTLGVGVEDIRQRSSSESGFQKKVLPKQSTTIGAISGAHGLQDDSGSESCDSLEIKKKDKKQLRLIPKFMRRTNHEK